MIVTREDADRPPVRFRHRRLLWKLFTWPLLLSAGALFGAYLVHDGIAREWVRQVASTCTNFGNYVRGVTHSPAVSEMRIEMGSGSLSSVTASRQRALAEGILFRDDEPWVSAAIAMQDKLHPVRMRLKGLMNDHRSTKKWSYRIATDTPLLGMTALSIQHPGTRGYLDEWLYREMMRAEGVLAPGYKFANIRFNGAQLGVHAIEEHVTSRTWLHEQQRREGVILRMDDTEIWRQRMALGMRSSVYAGGFLNTPVHDFQASRNRRDENLRAQRDMAVKLLFEFAAGHCSGSEVFDVEQVSRFLALHELWSCSHVLGPPNARFYFDATSGKLEPIAGDVMPEFERGPFLACLPSYARDERDMVNSVYWPPLYLKDPVAMEAYVRQLVRVSQPEYLEQFRTMLADEETKVLHLLWREYPQVQRRWNQLAARQKQLRELLNIAQPVIAYGASNENGIVIRIGNPLRLPVEILAVDVDGFVAETIQPVGDFNDVQSVWLDDQHRLVLPGRHFDEPMTYHTYVLREYEHVALTQEPPSVRIHARILGVDQVSIVTARMGSDLIRDVAVAPVRTAEQVAQDHEFLEWDSAESMLRFHRGSWEIHSDLLLPAGVSTLIEGETTLKFATDAMLLVSGPITFAGEIDSPIVLEPLDDAWPGFAVLHTNGINSMRHVTVRGARGVNRNGRMFDSSATFYESPVSIANCRFEDTYASNALSLMSSQFELRETHVRNAQNNAIFVEFSAGYIVQCSIGDVNNHAFRAIGSRLDIHASRASNIGGAAVKAERNSQVQVVDTAINQARVAAMSSDLSTVLVNRISVRECDVAFAAICEDRAYGPALINVANAEVENTIHLCQVQPGSRAKVNGRQYSGTPGNALDIQDLTDCSQQVRLNRPWNEGQP